MSCVAKWLERDFSLMRSDSSMKRKWRIRECCHSLLNHFTRNFLSLVPHHLSITSESLSGQTKIVGKDRVLEPSHRGVCAQNLLTRGLQNGDDVTLVPIFCAGHEGLYHINLLPSKIATKVL